MTLLLLVGMMNLAAMALLVAAVVAEKYWAWGDRLSRGLGVAALAAAVLIVVNPGLAPPLAPEPGTDTTAPAQMPMEAP